MLISVLSQDYIHKGKNGTDDGLLTAGRQSENLTLTLHWNISYTQGVLMKTMLYMVVF